MPIVVSSTVDKVMFSKKCDLTAKFYILRAENEENIEQKLLYLNNALANAQSDNLLIDVYKKRVKIYSELKLYQQSSENEEFIQKILQDEKLSTFQKTKRQISIEVVKKFEGNPHPRVADVLNKLSVRKDNKLITEKGIKSGTMIAAENHFCGILLESALYRRCRNCLKCNNLNLIPCIKCQLAMFCSEDCMNDAKFHRYECEVSQIAKIPFNFGGIQVGLRACFEMLYHFDDSVDEMIQFVKKCKNQTKTIFDIDPKKPLNLEKHAAMISLKHFSTNDCYDELVKTIKNVLEIYPKVRELFVTDAQKDFLVDFLVMQSTIDFIVHYDYELKVPTALSVNFMYNLMDHSCASNVYSIMADGRLFYFTKYPVEKGKQLYYNHILNFEESSYDIRKLTAKKCYEFDCRCTACLKQYPLLYSMKVYNKDVLKNAMDQREHIPNMKKKDLKNLLKENCKYIDSFYKVNFPCQEIYLLHLSNALILSKLLS